MGGGGVDLPPFTAYLSRVCLTLSQRGSPWWVVPFFVCGELVRTFYRWMPLELVKSGDDSEMKIRGVISSDNADQQGDIIDQDGSDYSPLLSNHGWLNDNHDKKTSRVLGVADKIWKAKLPDGSNGTMMEGRLTQDDEGRALYKKMQALTAMGRNFGFSIEGSIKKARRRPGGRGRFIDKCIVREVAITRCPVNTDTNLELVKSWGGLSQAFAKAQTAVSIEALTPESLEGGRPRFTVGGPTVKNYADMFKGYSPEELEDMKKALHEACNPGPTQNLAPSAANGGLSKSIAAQVTDLAKSMGSLNSAIAAGNGLDTFGGSNLDTFAGVEMAKSLDATGFLEGIEGGISQSLNAQGQRMEALTKSVTASAQVQADMGSLIKSLVETQRAMLESMSQPVAGPRGALPGMGHFAKGFGDPNEAGNGKPLNKSMTLAKLEGAFDNACKGGNEALAKALGDSLSLFNTTNTLNDVARHVLSA